MSMGNVYTHGLALGRGSVRSVHAYLEAVGHLLPEIVDLDACLGREVRIARGVRHDS
mgnify:CR=1 FL=1